LKGKGGPASSAPQDSAPARHAWAPPVERYWATVM
jgi:hypothetical protein